MAHINTGGPYTCREDKDSVPQLARWGNEGLARFHVPREATCWPNGILTLHCVSLGACGEMRVLRISKDQNKSFFLLATVLRNQEEVLLKYSNVSLCPRQSLMENLN